MYQVRRGLWWMRLSGRVGTMGCSLSMWNGFGVWLQRIIALDWSISQLGLTSTWGVCEMSVSFPLCLITKHWRFNCRPYNVQQLFVFVLMKDEIDLTNYYASQRGLYSSVFEANSAVKCVSLQGKWATVCRQWSSPFLSFFKFSPTKRPANRLSHSFPMY